MSELQYPRNPYAERFWRQELSTAVLAAHVRSQRNNSVWAVEHDLINGGFNVTPYAGYNATDNTVAIFQAGTQLDLEKAQGWIVRGEGGVRWFVARERRVAWCVMGNSPVKAVCHWRTTSDPKLGLTPSITWSTIPPAYVRRFIARRLCLPKGVA